MRNPAGFRSGCNAIFTPQVHFPWILPGNQYDKKVYISLEIERTLLIQLIKQLSHSRLLDSSYEMNSFSQRGTTRVIGYNWSPPYQPRAPVIIATGYIHLQMDTGYWIYSFDICKRLDFLVFSDKDDKP